MLGLPERTEFNKRIPKQKFYEKMDISPALKRVFVEQIRIIYWRNKLAATTMNIAAGEEVTEIEVFEVRVQEPQFDEAVLRQIDKEIPYHILFLLTCDRKEQAWIGYKEAAASGSNAFKVSRYYHTDWVPEGSLNFGCMMRPENWRRTFTLHRTSPCWKPFVGKRNTRPKHSSFVRTSSCAFLF